MIEELVKLHCTDIVRMQCDFVVSRGQYYSLLLVVEWNASEPTHQAFHCHSQGQL